MWLLIKARGSTSITNLCLLGVYNSAIKLCSRLKFIMKGSAWKESILLYFPVPKAYSNKTGILL